MNTADRAEAILEEAILEDTLHNLRSAFTPDGWDRLYFDLEGTPPPQHKWRLERDIKDVLTDAPPVVHAVPVNNKTARIHVLILGAADTPYDGGFFNFLTQCPPEYPLKPPPFGLINNDGGSVRFNPDFYVSGMVGLGLLETFLWPAWSPAMRLEDALVSIRSLLSKRLYFDQRGIHGDLRELYSDRYNRVVQHETIRVAVCDIVEGCLKRSSQCLQQLRQVILKTFLYRYKKYAKVLKSKFDLTGTTMCDVFGSLR
ncbi:hypothetical protein HPB50_027620 [Hyalomma asiaticum]|nr:hypothetical protein HPB50_027620 [Hyalomma asiaticum]